MARTQGPGGAAGRATGVPIEPEQLTRMRDLRALSREDLAERTGRLLFDPRQFGRILAGQAECDPQTARALWLALRCEPADIITGLPPGLARSQVPRWLRRDKNWSLDLAELAGFIAVRGLSQEELGAEASRFMFSRDAIAKLEGGLRKPKGRTLRAFCQILGCTPADLMPGSRRLPDGPTRDLREHRAWFRDMHAWADAQDPPVRYRNAAGRITDPPGLREDYARFLAGQADEALAS